MNRKRITIKEIAADLSVSVATISRAFSGNGRISEKTRERIISRANELGYRANIHARNLTSRHSNTIALFYPVLSHEEPDYFIAEIMSGINQSLAESKLQLQIHPFLFETPTSELGGLQEYILDGSFQGIIVVAGAIGSKQLIATAQSCGIPYSIIGHMGGMRDNSVLFDIEYGARQAGEYFRRTGRKFPAYIGGYLDRRKRQGFQAGFGDARQVIEIAGGSSLRHGGMAFEELRHKHPEVDCLLCANDILAIGVVKAALTNGIKIPEYLAVIGFDDIRVSRYFTPALSSVSLKLREIGVCSVKILINAIENPKGVSSETIECDLIIRQSS